MLMIVANDAIARPITSIAPLDKSNAEHFFSLLNQPQNKAAQTESFANNVKNYTFPDTSANPFYVKDKFNEEYQLKLYKLNLLNNNIYYYVMTSMYISSGYSGSSGINSIFSVDVNNHLHRDDNLEKNNHLFLANPHSGFYTNIDGFSHCGKYVCANFSIQPPARWNAMPNPINPFTAVHDQVIFTPGNHRVYQRHVINIKLSDEQEKVTNFSKNIKSQIQHNIINIDWFDYDTRKETDLSTLLRKLPQPIALKELTITNSKFNLTILSHWLGKVNNLTVINLNFDQLTSKDIKPLLKIINNNPNLETLNLAGDTFTAQSAVLLSISIKQLKNLHTINLAYSLFQQQDIESIVQALNQNTSIKNINLSHENLINQNARLALLSIIKNRHTEKLNLINNNLNYAAKSLKEILKTNTTLKNLTIIAGNLYFDDKFIAQLKKSYPSIKIS